MGANISSPEHQGDAASESNILGGHQHHALNASPFATASIKPSEADVESLRATIHASGISFHPQNIRASEAEVTQAAIARVEQFFTAMHHILERHWDKHCPTSSLSTERMTTNLAEQCAIITDAINDIQFESNNLLRSILTIVAEAEIKLLSSSATHGGAGPNARGASQRNKAKLQIQLHLEKNTEIIETALNKYIKAILANMEVAVDTMTKPLHRLMEEERRRPEGSTVIPQGLFIDHVVSTIITVLDPPKLVEEGELLKIIHGSEPDENKEGEKSTDAGLREHVSTRVQLHASRLIANAAKRHENQTTASVVQEIHEKAENKFTVLTVETSDAMKRLLDAKEKQLEALIVEVHKFGCIPPMCTTLTNSAGTQIVELDVPGGRQFEFREVRADTGEVRRGRYCRLSPAVIILSVQTIAHANGVTEHDAESITLVREEGVGWRNLTSGVVYSTVIPSYVNNTSGNPE